MSVFNDAELEYLASQRLGRLGTVGKDGQPHVVPVAFRYNPEADTIDIGGQGGFATRKKWRDVQQTGRASIVIDDVLPPWQPRFIEIRGTAERPRNADPELETGESLLDAPLHEHGHRGAGPGSKAGSLDARGAHAIANHQAANSRIGYDEVGPVAEHEARDAGPVREPQRRHELAMVAGEYQPVSRPTDAQRVQRA